MQTVPTPLPPIDGNTSHSARGSASRAAAKATRASVEDSRAQRIPFSAHLGRDRCAGRTDVNPLEVAPADSQGAGTADQAQDARTEDGHDPEAYDSSEEKLEDSDGIGAASAAESQSSRTSAEGKREGGGGGSGGSSDAEADSGENRVNRESLSKGGERQSSSTVDDPEHSTREQAQSKSKLLAAREASGSRTELRSLTTLLEKHVAMTQTASENMPQPAVARAEQVQQMLALEHAAQQAALGARTSQGGLQTIALQGGTDDVRQSVLSEVVTREGAQLKAESRSHMLAARAVGALASQRGGTLTMRLDPPSLGELAMRMTVIDGVVRAELTTTNNMARALLEQGLEMLRTTLETRGLHVERLSVHGPGSGSESNSTRWDSHSNSSEGFRHDDADDAAGRESRGRGGESRERESEEASSSPATFEEVLEQD